MLFPRSLFFPLLSVQTFALFYKKEESIPFHVRENVYPLPFKKKVPTLTSQNLTRNVKF